MDEERIHRFMRCRHRNVQQFTEVCLDCGENIYTTEAEIRRQEEKKAAAERERPWNEYNNW